jgi:low affinity Fe/Cu permease
MAAKRNQSHSFIEKLSANVTKAVGSTPAICVAFGLVILWAGLGPVFHYSESWQLVINTGTTIITFLMVFLIQRSQNKESLATQLKLNELIAAHEFASNRLVDVEDLNEEQLKLIHDYYCELKDKTKKEESLQKSHSIDEAEDSHQIKKNIEKNIRVSVNNRMKKK